VLAARGGVDRLGNAPIFDRPRLSVALTQTIVFGIRTEQQSRLRNSRNAETPKALIHVFYGVVAAARICRSGRDP
jgi:hypothetical protein